MRQGLACCILILFMGLHGYGYERWDIKAKNTFKSAQCLGIAFGIAEDASVLDLSEEEFLATSSQSVNVRNDGEYLIRRIFNRLFSRLKKAHIDNLEIIKYDEACQCDFILKIELDEVSDKGGIAGRAFLVEIGTNKAKVFPFSISDGKWNSFDELVLESTDNLAKIIANKISYYRGYPAKPFNW